MTKQNPNRPLEWTNLLLGGCLACAALAMGGLPAAAWDAGTVGVLIACCSAAALARYGAWAEWTNIGLGCWAVAAPFVLGFGAVQAPMWAHVILGACVVGIAAVQLVSASKATVGRNRPVHG
ncbi:SPW repeat protein [Methylobacterium sp. C1]|uniref:SPW repeat protein n=1 Tax=Methylobacterium sp. C1 TaxID=1479019 RepID=UPI0008DB1452|nr:SPW repeat protein [Methylobacterium sp. C1]